MCFNTFIIEKNKVYNLFSGKKKSMCYFYSTGHIDRPQVCGIRCLCVFSLASVFSLWMDISVTDTCHSLGTAWQVGRILPHSWPKVLLSLLPWCPLEFCILWASPAEAPAGTSGLAAGQRGWSRAWQTLGSLAATSHRGKDSNHQPWVKLCRSHKQFQNLNGL